MQRRNKQIKSKERVQVHGTARTYMGKELRFPEWTFASDRMIERKDYSLSEIQESGGECKKRRRKKTYYWLAECAGVGIATHHLLPALQE